MRSITRCAMLCTIALMAMSLAPYESLAYEKRDIGLTDSSSYSDLTSQMGKWANWSWRYSLDMLGIADMDFIGTFYCGEDERRWSFKTEPEIEKVDPEGPSHGKLKEGDVIVAIDGILIATRRAGSRFANLTAGEPVELEVRRSRDRRVVTVIPREVQEPIIPIEITVLRTEQSRKENSITVQYGRTILPEYAPMIEKIMSRQAELTAMADSMGVLASPQYLDRAPRGWIGFGLAFSGSIRRNDNGKPADWIFFELPTIKSIQPGSPADKAGLQVDDVLLEIDGKRLDGKKGSKRFSRMEPGHIIEWKVQRDDETFTVETKAGQRPQVDLSEAKSVSNDHDTLKPLQYTGTLGDTEVEVRGDQNVRVDVDEETGEIIIRSDGSVVRLKSKTDAP